MAYSLAWMVSDILKSVLSLFQMSWSLYQLSYSVQPNARMIQYSVLVTSSVGIAFSAGFSAKRLGLPPVFKSL
eukprot:1393403-Amorphochlora_amoeboformis.AAC.1